MTTKETSEPTRNETHTYPDGSQRIGTAPFPKESPLEVQAAAKAEEDSRITGEALVARAEQQLTSDVMSGKDPETPNPTTDSAKPALANVITADQLETAMTAEPTADDIARIAKQIEPEGNIDATAEQKEAAVVQVLRETKGLPVVKTPRKNAKAK